MATGLKKLTTNLFSWPRLLSCLCRPDQVANKRGSPPGRSGRVFRWALEGTSTSRPRKTRGWQALQRSSQRPGGAQADKMLVGALGAEFARFLLLVVRLSRSWFCLIRKLLMPGRPRLRQVKMLSFHPPRPCQRAHRAHIMRILACGVGS